MGYIIRKTILSDVEHLPLAERSAGSVFKSLPGLAWIADDSVMSVEEHKSLLATGLSWVAIDFPSQKICGFINAEIIEGELYVGEVSVNETHQNKGMDWAPLLLGANHGFWCGDQNPVLNGFGLS